MLVPYQAIGTAGFMKWGGPRNLILGKAKSGIPRASERRRNLSSRERFPTDLTSERDWSWHYDERGHVLVRAAWLADLQASV